MLFEILHTDFKRLIVIIVFCDGDEIAAKIFLLV